MRAYFCLENLNLLYRAYDLLIIVSENDSLFLFGFSFLHACPEEAYKPHFCFI